MNVARTKSSDDAFSLILLFRNPLKPEAFQSLTGKILLRLPMIGGADAQGVAVQQLRAALWVPREYALIGTPRNFSSDTWTCPFELMFDRQQASAGTQDLDNWIGADAGGVFEFPVEGRRYVYSNLGGRDTSTKDRTLPPLATIEGLRWWHLSSYTWIVSGAIIVCAFILRRTSWENKLTILIVVVFCASAYALHDVDAVTHAVAVSAYGWAALLAIWLVHALLSRQPTLASVNVPPVAPPPVVAPPVVPPPVVPDVKPSVESPPPSEPSSDQNA